MASQLGSSLYCYKAAALNRWLVYATRAKYTRFFQLQEKEYQHVELLLVILSFPVWHTTVLKQWPPAYFWREWTHSGLVCHPVKKLKGYLESFLSILGHIYLVRSCYTNIFHQYGMIQLAKRVPRIRSLNWNISDFPLPEEPAIDNHVLSLIKQN